jgi:hypothetical protein
LSIVVFPSNAVIGKILDANSLHQTKDKINYS